MVVVAGTINHWMFLRISVFCDISSSVADGIIKIDDDDDTRFAIDRHLYLICRNFGKCEHKLPQIRTFIAPPAIIKKSERQIANLVTRVTTPTNTGDFFN